MKSKSVAFGLSLVVLLLPIACQKKSPPTQVEVFLPDQGSVAFEAQRTSTKPDGTEMWDARYTADGQTAHFKFEIGSPQPLDKSQGLGFGHGRIVSVPQSQSQTLLIALKIALEAKKLPQASPRAAELGFTYADLGSGLSQSSGGFSMNPPGHWRALKLFLGQVGDDDDIEVFLNLNPDLGKGEFSIKDPDYGNDVLIQLAKVL